MPRKKIGTGATLCALREARKWSQAQLAVVAGVTNMTVSRIERNETQPRRRTVQRLARALETSVAHLVTGHRSNDAPPDVLTDRLLTLWRALPTDHRTAGIEALAYVVNLSGESRKLRAEVRALERVVEKLRRTSARPARSAKAGRGSAHPARRAG